MSYDIDPQGSLEFFLSRPVKWIGNLQELIEEGDSESFSADYMIYLEGGHEKSLLGGLKIVV